MAERAGIGTALVVAGIGTIATTALALLAKLPESTADMSPWIHLRMPGIVRQDVSYLQQGPVLVTVEYSVVSEKATEFVEAIYQHSRIRRRDGAYRWGVYRDTEVVNRYLEIFLVHSWAEHLRQHERMTQADVELEKRLRSCVTGDTVVHHLIYSHSEDT
jgi:hypothetical protein